jgi:signal peptidase I
MSEKRRAKLVEFWRKQIRPLAIIIMVVFAFRSSVADWNDVPTQSMEPTLLVGDRIFVNRLAYDLKIPFTTWHIAEWSAPARGDIVVFFNPDDGKRMVKRIIGVPGDRIAMIGNRLFINGAPAPIQPQPWGPVGSADLADPPPHVFATEQIGAANHAIMVQPEQRAVRSFNELTVPADQYFVMGDNRDNSRDSRFWGFVPRDKILGKALGVAFSLDHDAHYLPRWERFFRDVD